MHTVKGFGIVSKAEVDFFLELSCFFDDPTDVSNLISGSSAFSKSSLNIWNFNPQSPGKQKLAALSTHRGSQCLFLGVHRHLHQEGRKYLWGLGEPRLAMTSRHRWGAPLDARPGAHSAWDGSSLGNRLDYWGWWVSRQNTEGCQRDVSPQVLKHLCMWLGLVHMQMGPRGHQGNSAGVRTFLLLSCLPIRWTIPISFFSH